MFAPISSAQMQSRISIQFGQKITEEKTPISIDLTFDIFSQKVHNCNISHRIKAIAMYYKFFLATRLLTTLY